MMKKIGTFTIKKDRYGFLATCKCNGCMVSSPIPMSDDNWRIAFTNHTCYPEIGFDIKLPAKRAWEKTNG